MEIILSEKQYNHIRRNIDSEKTKKYLTEKLGDL